MPTALDPGDRKLLLGAGAILFLLIAATVLLAPPTGNNERGIPTTYSTAAGGTQAAYQLLRELGYRSERWEKSLTELPGDAGGTILIVAGPADVPSKKERDALLAFVSAGGWVIHAGNFASFFLGSGPVATPPGARTSSSETTTFAAVTPSAFTRNAPKITMNASDHWEPTDGSQIALYGKPEAAVVVTWRLGKGRVLWWAAPTPMLNSEIMQQGNLPFFLSCIQTLRPEASPMETTVLWDEYFHGYRQSLWEYFRKTPVPWAALQLLLVSAFVLLAYSRRSGPLYTPATVTRLSPLEFVDTLGDLYRRAGAGSAAVRVAYQRFRTLLLRRLALSPSTSNMQLDAAARERLGWKRSGLFDTLRRAEKASRESEVYSSEALRIVQALEHYEVLFGLKARPREEKR